MHFTFHIGIQCRYRLDHLMYHTILSEIENTPCQSFLKVDQIFNLDKIAIFNTWTLKMERKVICGQNRQKYLDCFCLPCPAGLKLIFRPGLTRWNGVLPLIVPCPSVHSPTLHLGHHSLSRCPWTRINLSEAPLEGEINVTDWRRMCQLSPDHRSCRY